MAKKSNKNGSEAITSAGSGELPEEWTEVDFRSLLTTLETGSRPRGGVRGIDNGIPSLGGEHLDANGGFDFSNIRYVPEEYFASMRRGHIEKGDILIVKDGATTGKVSLVRDDFPFDRAVLNEHVFRCPVADGIEPSFMFWFLWSREGQERVLEHFQGSAQGGINQGFATGTEVPVAPSEEQKRIVAKVEALLERVGKARERLERVPDILKKFRQSVLAAACSGRLTADWREENPDEEPPDILLERIATEAAQLVEEKTIRRSKPLSVLRQDEMSVELPKAWRWIQAQDACVPSEIITYGILKPEWVADGVPTVRIKDMQDGRIVIEDVVQCSPERAAKFSKTTLKTGDLLVAKDGATLGKTAFVPESLDGGNVTQHVLRFPISRHLSREFIRLVVDSPDGQAWMKGETKGVALPGVNVGDFRRMPVPLPPLSEQYEVVSRVRGLFKVVSRIEHRLKQAMKDTDQITQSVLAKAFAGELVETEAELARREGRDYEPASVLLERIAAERAASSAKNNGQPKRRKTTRKKTAKR